MCWCCAKFWNHKHSINNVYVHNQIFMITLKIVCFTTKRIVVPNQLVCSIESLISILLSVEMHLPCMLQLCHLTVVIQIASHVLHTSSNLYQFTILISISSWIPVLFLIFSLFSSLSPHLTHFPTQHQLFWFCTWTYIPFHHFQVMLQPS